MKICKHCEKEFVKPYPMSDVNFAKREFCDRTCRTAWRHEHPEEEKGVFKPGNKVWNKGDKGLKPWMNLKPMFDHNKKHGPHNKKKRLSEETKAKIRDARATQDMSSRRGKNHPNWKGGTSALRKLVQQLNLYRNWRTSVFKRDDYTCQHCGQRGGRLNADHIKSYASIIAENDITTVEEAKKCHHLWDVDNGQTLCIPCHQKTGTYGSKSIV